MDRLWSLVERRLYWPCSVSCRLRLDCTALPVTVVRSVVLRAVAMRLPSSEMMVAHEALPLGLLRKWAGRRKGSRAEVLRTLNQKAPPLRADPPLISERRWLQKLQKTTKDLESTKNY